MLNECFNSIIYIFERKRITMRMRILFFSLLFLFIIPFGYSMDTAPFLNRVRFKHITTKNGLYSNNIKKIVQDKKGYVWFGGFGLYRYDGYEIKEYINTPEGKNILIGNYINNLYVDSKNNLWVVCSNGLYIYNRDFDIFNKVRFSHEIDDFSKTILFEQDETLFIVLDSIYYTPIGSNKHTLMSYCSINKSGINRALFFDSENNVLYLSGTNGNLFYMPFNQSQPDKKISKVDLFPPPANDIITYMSANRYYIVVAYKKSGIQVYDKSDSTAYFYKYEGKKGINNNQVKTIYIENQNKIWIGTGGGGINLLSPKSKSFTYYKHNKFDRSSLSSNIILDIYENSQGIIWIGTLNGGVNYYHKNQKPFYHFTYDGGYSSNNLSNNVINAIMEDWSGNIWIGTDKGGVNVLNTKTGKIKYLQHDPLKPNSVSSNNILSLAKDKNGYIWIGTWEGGLNRYDPKTGKFRHFKHNPKDTTSLAWNNVWSLHVDDSNNLWIGFNSNKNAGLDLYNRKNETFFHFSKKDNDPTSLVQNSVEKIQSDSKGNLWIGTTGNGLDRFNKKDSTFSHFKIWPVKKKYVDHGLIIRSIYEDSKGRLWIGTDGGGLNRLDYETETLQRFTTKDGLPSNIVASILEDNCNNLWLGTSKGLCKFNPDSMIVINYNPVDDFKGSQFSWGATKATNGIMYFGTLQGVIAFYPDSIKQNIQVPPVELTGFYLAGQDAGLNIPGSPLTKHINQAETITLTHKQKIFSFRYAGLSYTNAEKIKYAYKMEGLENKWNNVGEIRYATYTNLDPGQYTFKVKASNNEGVWGNNIKSINVVILPPWWKTFWFKLITVVVIIISIILLYRWRIASYKKQQRILENKVDEKTSQLTMALEDLKEKNEEIEQQNDSIQEKLNILEKQKTEIIKQKDEVTRISKKLHQNDQMKLKLFTSISHEVRTPLTLIIAPIHNLIKTTKDNRALEKLNIIKKNANHLLNLINQLMDFRKMEADKIYVKPAKGDIIRFINNICSTFSLFANNHQINYLVKSNAQSEICYFDPDVLEKILYNLLSNAFKFTPFRGKIKVYSEIHYTNNKPTEINVSVKDNGKGIPEKDIPHLFQRFYQVENSESNYLGTGIGLSLVKNLVDLHKGTISVKSSLGKGSEFTFRLPINLKMNEGQKVVKELEIENYRFTKHNYDPIVNDTESKKIKGKFNPKKDNILIVEDNNDLRKYIKSELIQAYNVYEAGDGEEGVNIAKKLIPDLIISDLLMPKMKGSQLCKLLKNNPVTNHIPIIMLTAVTSDIKRLDSYTKGADAYITKPFNADELIIRVSNLIKTRKEIKEKVAKELIMQPGEIKVASADDEFLKQTINVIEEHISDTTFSVDSLASKMGMSNSQFYLKLMAIANHSPLDFIRKIRLKRAIQLLKSNEYRISEISYEVGFQDPKYFTKIFKKEFKVTPTEYLKNL